MNTKGKRENAIEVARKLAGSPLNKGLSKVLPFLLENQDPANRPCGIHVIMFEFLGMCDGDGAANLLPVYTASLEDVDKDAVKGLIKLYWQIPALPDLHFRKDQWDNVCASRHAFYRAVLIELAKRWVRLLSEQAKDSTVILEFFLNLFLSEDHSMRQDELVIESVREASKDVKLTLEVLQPSIMKIIQCPYPVKMGYEHQALLAFARLLFIAGVRNMELETMASFLEFQEP